jgi:predicted nicotinamide N-methyase
MESKVNIDIGLMPLPSPLNRDSSILFAQALLQQLHSTSSQDALFSRQLLGGARVLELGSGTGLLGLILAPFTGHHTCTDLPELVPLIKKNILLNGNLLSESPDRLSYDALNWNDVYECPPTARERLFLKGLSETCTGENMNEGILNPGFDLILAVDCVYNPSLISPLLTTIDLYTVPERTAVLVVMELRDEDVLREFLTQWSGMPGWEIWSVGNETHPSLLDERFSMWIGFKEIKF